MSEFPLISVVIPCFNSEQYLSYCIESVLSQDYPAMEVVVVDDGSVDRSRDILNQYMSLDSRVKGVLKVANEGVVQARQDGIDNSSGEYITTLDSDDIYLSSKKLSNEYQVIKNLEKTSGRPIVAFSKIEIISPNGKPVGDHSLPVVEGEIFVSLLSRSVMIPRDFLFRKSIYYEVGGFDPNIPLYEDWDLKLRLSKIANFQYSGFSGIGYRRHNSGLSSTKFRRHIYWLIYVFIKNYSLQDLPSYSKAIIPFTRKCYKLTVRGIEKYFRKT
jgi:glycosyltransferase involved in cell wall biosynthesis